MFGWYLQAEELKEEQKVVEEKHDEYEQDSSDEEVRRSCLMLVPSGFSELFCG